MDIFHQLQAECLRSLAQAEASVKRRISRIRREGEAFPDELRMARMRLDTIKMEREGVERRNALWREWTGEKTPRPAMTPNEYRRHLDADLVRKATRGGRRRKEPSALELIKRSGDEMALARYRFKQYLAERGEDAS